MEKQTRAGRRLRGEMEADTEFVAAEGLGAVNDGAAHGHRVAINVDGEVQRRFDGKRFFGFDGEAFGGDLEKRPCSSERCAIFAAPDGLHVSHDRVSAKRTAQDRFRLRGDDGADAAQPFIDINACWIGIGFGHC